MLANTFVLFLLLPVKESAARAAPITLLWLLPGQALDIRTLEVYTRIVADSAFAKCDAFGILSWPNLCEL